MEPWIFYLKETQQPLQKEENLSDFALMRQNMVKGQLLPEGITDLSLIKAFSNIPKEIFVPRQLSHVAYMDSNFPISGDRILLRPATLARLLQALNPSSMDKILYIAGGSGYGPALLSSMGATVVALESEEILSQEAERILKELNLTSINIVLGPLENGWAGDAPYSKIMIEGCIETLPDSLFQQLNEGGKIATVKETKGILYVKEDSTLTEMSLFDAFAPKLLVFKKQKPFIF
ncbi:MAG TPA: protein-L-isoaspartate O-methyltransferase [Holosporales bacterium]|nr:protein-L-isoaspartate O-methyltransferase [Holosporales bacterium]HBW25625.1 protein-L-isoaspartate O-methyltransferase [Holosporales bacterium]HCC25142.1 protein-L-isoaspartate O-methyltransferase [Holosporales bacterium]HCE96739.1 protein-L-isoaspartate O-methyltransferase [Holosporales bacterium]